MSWKGEKGGVVGPLARGTSSLGEQLMGHLGLELGPGCRRQGPKKMTRAQEGEQSGLFRVEGGVCSQYLKGAGGAWSS